MREEDWEVVRAIYQEGIATGNATFEVDVPGWEKWNRNHWHQCRLVAKEGEQVVGWAALSPVSSRAVYSGVAEVSIYVAASARRKGIGKALLRALVTESEEAGIWMLQGSIFPENVASVGLHRACGFREVGYRERIGRAASGIWRDTILMERRSKVVGVERSTVPKP